MPLFNVQDNLPSIYPNESRDFQLLCKLYDCINNGVMGDIKSMTSVTFTKECRDDVLRLLSTKLGFFPDIDISDESLRYILMAFPEIMKYKGSKAGIEGVLNVFTKINHLAYPIDYSLEGIGYTKRDSYETSLTIADVVSSTLNISVSIPSGFEQAIESMKIDVTFNGVKIHSDIVLPIANGSASVSGLWCGAIEEGTVIGVNYNVGVKSHGGKYPVEKTVLYGSTEYDFRDSIVSISTSLDSLFVCAKFTEAEGIGSDTSKKWSSYLDPDSDILVCVNNLFTYEFMDDSYAYYIYTTNDEVPSGYTISAYLTGHTKYGTDIQGKTVETVDVSAAGPTEVELTFVGVNLCLGPDQIATLNTLTHNGVIICATEEGYKDSSSFTGKTSSPYGTRYEYTENIPVNYGKVTIESKFANTITYSNQIDTSWFETTNVSELQCRPNFPIYGVSIDMSKKNGFKYRYDARCVLGDKQGGESDLEWRERYWGPVLGVGDDITLTDTESEKNYFKEFKVRGIRFVGGKKTTSYDKYVDNAYTTFEYLLTDCGANDTVNTDVKGEDLFDYSAFKVFSNQQDGVVSEQSDSLYVSKWYSARNKSIEGEKINARYTSNISAKRYDYITPHYGILPDSSYPVCTFSESVSARYVSSITNYFVFRYFSILYLLTCCGVSREMMLYGVYRSFSGNVKNYDGGSMGLGIEPLVAYRDDDDKNIHYGFAYPDNGGVLSFVDVLSVSGEKKIENGNTLYPSVFFGDGSAQSVYCGSTNNGGAFGLCPFYTSLRLSASNKLLAYGSSLVSVTNAYYLPYVSSSHYGVGGRYIASLIVYKFNRNT